MTIELWWARLRPETREWLIANNGDAVPPAIVEEIAAVGGPSASDAWWEEQEGSPGRCMPDEAIDWIEQVANDEAQ
jgi:hypothetical protein